MNKFGKINQQEKEEQPHYSHYNAEILHTFQSEFDIQKQTGENKCREKVQNNIKRMRIAPFQLQIEKSIRNGNQKQQTNQSQHIHSHSFSF